MRLYYLFCALLIFIVPSSLFAQKGSPAQIMIFNSYHKGFLWTDEIVESVRETISNKIETADFYIEYMDTKRVYSQELLQNINENLKIKYSNNPMDIIIASDDNALLFLIEYRDELFQDTPVVFCGINDIETAQSLDRNFFTGITETQDIENNIILIKRILPETDTVYVVTDDTPTGIGTRNETKAAESSFPELSFRYLNGEDLTTEQLLSSLRLLDEGDVVLAPAWYKDKGGNFFSNTEIYPMLSENSAVPVISPSAANLGLGPLGGKLNSGREQGRLAAEYALDILINGKSPGQLPVKLEGQNTFMFDSRQLSRFKIKESILPAGSTILNRPFSFYRNYRLLVNSIISIFVLFIIFIIILMMIISRLNTTKQNLSYSEELYKAIVEDTPSLIIRYSPDGKIIFSNKASSELISPSGEAVANENIEELVDVQNFDNFFSSAFELSSKSPKRTGEIILKDSSGSDVWYRWTDHALFDENGNIKVIQAIGENVSNYKNIEHELTESLKEKNILLKEIHHRVKNNMQIIIALLNMQKQISDKILKSILQDIINRIQIFSDIHTNLYSYDNVSQIDFLAHLKSNFINLSRIYSKDAENIELELNIDDPFLDLDDAIPCGLLLNELMTNSMKHALEASGMINISISKNPDGAIDFIEYFDSGTAYSFKQTGFGSTIIEALSQQLELEHKIITDKHVHHVFKLEEMAEASGDLLGKILFIEDEVLIAMNKISLLQENGFPVESTIFNSGETAVEFIKHPDRKPGLIIMDIKLSGEMNGIDAAENVRKYYPDIPVLFISGYENPFVVEQVLKFDNSAYLRKTCTDAEFIEAVKRLFNPAYSSSEVN